VFIVPKEQSNNTRFRHGPSVSAYTTLLSATSVTNQLIKPAVQLVDELFEDGRLYKKAGVMLSGLVKDTSVQGNLFVPEATNKSRLLMSMMDNINFAMRDDMIKFASSGTSRDWKMRQELRSPRYTTRWDELYEVS
jgi:DNA polymerase V